MVRYFEYFVKNNVIRNHREVSSHSQVILGPGCTFLFAQMCSALTIVVDLGIPMQVSQGFSARKFTRKGLKLTSANGDSHDHSTYRHLQLPSDYSRYLSE